MRSHGNGSTQTRGRLRRTFAMALAWTMLAGACFSTGGARPETSAHPRGLPSTPAGAIRGNPQMLLARIRIKHIVFMVKENRTFDTYFGTFPGADGATHGQTCDGSEVPLARPTEDEPEREREFADVGVSPYGDLKNKQLASAIEKAVGNLPPDYRELIQLRHFAELSYEEIASMKKLPLGTVKNKLFRARNLLKVELESFVEP